MDRERQLTALRRLQSLLVVRWPDADDLNEWRRRLTRQATDAELELPAARAAVLASGYPVPDEWLRVSPWGLARGWCTNEEYRQTLQEIDAAVLRLHHVPAEPETVENNGDTKRPNTNARMMDVLSRNPEAREWSAAQWAEALGCAKTTIAETKCWQSLKVVKAESRLAKHQRKSIRRRARKNPND